MSSTKANALKELITPSYHEFEEFQNRSTKLKEIQDLNITPYPNEYNRTAKTNDIISKFENSSPSHDDAASGNTDEYIVAGRVVLFRAMGKNAFAQIQDESGKIQIMFNRDKTIVTGLEETSDATIKPIKFIEKKIDLGDIVGIKGHVFKTQKGETTLFAKEVTLLCKTLLPLADKHSGLADKGMRYRKRWLDLITNQSVLETFKVRSHILRETRKYFENLEFIEVETPTLQNQYGGAEAKPFTTELNALNQEMFLRIALEIPLKKLIVGGFEKIFEIGKVFRNEGLDKTHNPEFTMLEAYGAYMDYNDIMVITENLFEHLAVTLFGSAELERADKDGNMHKISLKTPWKRMTMKESIKTYGNVDTDALSVDEIKAILKKTEADPDKIKKSPRGKLIAMLFEELVEHHLIQPHHITDHPIETTPLCKPLRENQPKDEVLVERFESFILGYEFCNAYTELNDPVTQRKLLEDQAQKKLDGDDEANPLDEEFIEAICQGMPPTGGLGVGIDRLTMLLTGMTSIRDVLFFPMMKPESE